MRLSRLQFFLVVGTVLTSQAMADEPSQSSLLHPPISAGRIAIAEISKGSKSLEGLTIEPATEVIQFYENESYRSIARVKGQLSAPEWSLSWKERQIVISASAAQGARFDLEAPLNSDTTATNRIELNAIGPKGEVHKISVEIRYLNPERAQRPNFVNFHLLAGAAIVAASEFTSTDTTTMLGQVTAPRLGGEFYFQRAENPEAPSWRFGAIGWVGYALPSMSGGVTYALPWSGELQAKRMGYKFLGGDPFVAVTGDGLPVTTPVRNATSIPFGSSLSSFQSRTAITIWAKFGFTKTRAAWGKYSLDWSPSISKSTLSRSYTMDGTSSASHMTLSGLLGGWRLGLLANLRSPQSRWFLQTGAQLTFLTGELSILHLGLSAALGLRF